MKEYLLTPEGKLAVWAIVIQTYKTAFWPFGAWVRSALFPCLVFLVGHWFTNSADLPIVFHNLALAFTIGTSAALFSVSWLPWILRAEPGRIVPEVSGELFRPASIIFVTFVLFALVWIALEYEFRKALIFFPSQSWLSRIYFDYYTYWNHPIDVLFLEATMLFALMVVACGGVISLNFTNHGRKGMPSLGTKSIGRVWLVLVFVAVPVPILVYNNDLWAPITTFWIAELAPNEYLVAPFVRKGILLFSFLLTFVLVVLLVTALAWCYRALAPERESEAKT